MLNKLGVGGSDGAAGHDGRLIMQKKIKRFVGRYRLGKGFIAPGYVLVGTTLISPRRKLILKGSGARYLPTYLEC